jgi:bifunctional non-homologous end joining protein LigD
MQNIKKAKPVSKTKAVREVKTSKKSKENSAVSVNDKPANTDRVYEFGKNKVTVTNVNKIYFPKEKITKGDVVDYYVSMADYILPYLKGRPESLLRNPNGIDGQSFFQKDAADNAPDFVKNAIVHSESNDKEINYIVCDNLATLVYLNNLGCIEMNPWHSTVKALDKPDYLMIDIDPSEKNTFEQVIETALVVKNVLDKAGAVSYCKTSGASGMHIYVPTGKKYTFEQVKDFAYLICMLASEELKAFTTLERNLKKRGNKHIYMDYLQNRPGQTIASVYSVRPKPGATVSMPLLWEEVKSGLSPKEFTIGNTLDRVNRLGDIFKGVLGKGIDLSKCLRKLA